jgi:hypothetical protein
MTRLFAVATILAGALTAAAADGRFPPPPVDGPPPPPPPMRRAGGPPPAQEVSRAWHNGSVVAVIASPRTGTLRIEYIAPRPGLAELGVMPGTPLLTGRWARDELSATAFVFSRCGPIPYEVLGGTDATGSLTLQGLAPVVNPDTCMVFGQAWTMNSVLTFLPIRGPLP